MHSEYDLGIVRQRVRVLELAKELGNVSEACRRCGISRTQFYVYRQRFQANGIEGLRNRPTVHLSHPQKKPPSLEKLILALSMTHPSWGCDRLAEHLQSMLETVSSQTVQKILRRNKMGTRNDRWLKLEALRDKGSVVLTDEQVVLMEKLNPAFRERHVELSHPGELLSQYVIGVGKLIDVGRVYLHAVIDDFSNYAFGYLYPSKKPEAAVAILQNEVLPIFEDWGLSIEAILTNNGREFCGTELHPYELFLSDNNIIHVNSPKQKRHTSGFLQRFRATVLSEFFSEAYRTKFFRSIDDLQSELDIWLAYYNVARPNPGYPNNGHSPEVRIREHLGEKAEVQDQQSSGRIMTEVGAAQ
jgi:transposase InsO family protein